MGAQVEGMYARDRRRLFHPLGLERFWNEANLPQKLLKKSLDKRRGATLSDKPLALTLQRKNQKALERNARRNKMIVVHENTAL